jgi:hypothetical protein
MKQDELRPEDLAQECNAYMEIKHFMSKRILEQEEEIDSLKTLLLYHSGKHLEMYDWLKNINETIIGKNEIQPSLSNFSAEIVDSIVDETVDISTIKSENLDLIKQNEALRTEIIMKNLQISKLSSEKLILINELTELLISLKRVNTNKLNKFYMENADEITERVQITSALGLKYNILSTQHQLSCIIKSDNKCELKFDSQFNVMKHFSDVLKESLDKNLAKTKILDK